jgi:hypothetical protein
VRGEGAYANPEAALTAVGDWYNAWTKALSDRSVELSYAVIAANWAVFGSRDRILSSPCAKLSIGLVVAFLGLNLLLTRLIAELTRKQYAYAESDLTRWQGEFERSRGKAVPWPSTRIIDGAGRLLREARTWLPLAAGVAFVLAFF